MTSMPFWNLMPWKTFGNWFSPFNRRHVFAAAVTSLNTMSLAVFARAAQPERPGHVGCATERWWWPSTSRNKLGACAEQAKFLSLHFLFQDLTQYQE